MTEQSLNLARKWRSKNFDTIVGQELCVRMLKNSLYLNQFFPVYLFSGQRGCGKTTTARVFAAALNCSVLPEFQKSPKQSLLPCGICVSCEAMLTSKHPDFIEIDAASHTGVDNVRQIIETSSLLPLMGRKKIYLIDEAHMLSKAAFNAFLKILEEPPTSVVFILATTDAQKIIDTVKSRCFQLFFAPINQQSLLHHLIMVCKSENINYEEDGLAIIVKESEGSARDALNLLEQVRFSAPIVNKQTVLQSLGQLPDDQLHELFNTILNGNHTQLIALLQEIKFESYAAEHMYQALIDITRSSLWLKHGVNRKTEPEGKKLHSIISSIAVGRLSSLLELLCQQELAFAKTTKKHLFLEMLLLKICAQDHEPILVHEVPKQPEKKSPLISEEVQQPQPTSEAVPSHSGGNEAQSSWSNYLHHLETLSDPLLKSIFCQALFEHHDIQSGKIAVTFSHELSFFNDWLNDTKSLWLPLIQSVFGPQAYLDPVFKEGVKVAAPQVDVKVVQPIAVPKPQAPVEKKRSQQYERDSHASSFKRKPKEKIIAINVSNSDEWRTAHMLLKYFPGTIVELPGVENV